MPGPVVAKNIGPLTLSLIVKKEPYFGRKQRKGTAAN